MAALGFAGLPRPSYDGLSTPCAPGAIPGHVVVGWRARATTSSSRDMTRRAGARTFYTTGMEHWPTSATGTGWERTPWHATRRAAWEALLKAEENRP